jgi:tetratricopeptide (TPR) repeat protein
MRHFWRVRGHGAEARRRLEEAYERSSRVGASLRARVVYETAVIRMAAGDYEGDRQAWLEALPVYEELGEALHVGRIDAELAALSNATGDPDAAIAYGRAAAERFEGEDFLQLIVLGNLAESYEQVGDVEQARATALDVLERQRRIGDRDGVAYMSLALASIALAAGDPAEAQRRLIECLTVASEIGFVELTGYALGLAGQLALELGAPEDAASLVAASQETFRTIGATPQVQEAARHERVLAAAGEQLGDIEPALTRGRGLRRDEAAALAMALDGRGR